MFSSSSLSMIAMVDCEDGTSTSQRNYLLDTRLAKMVLNDNSTCNLNCSGHGDCYNGTCFCEVITLTNLI